MSLFLFLLISSIQIITLKAENASFSTDHYNISVPENQPAGTPVLSLELTLQNISLISLLPLSLSGPFNSNFLLANTTIYTTTVLDREKNPFYQLTVSALYNASIVATSNVSINVGDVNDNAPICAHTFYSVSVNESCTSNEILAVQCWDVDAGNNASLRYQLQNHNSTFSINATGVLSLTQTLDYEQRPDGLLLELLVSDLGDPPLSTLISVLVTVLPVNEFAPQITNYPLSSSISENTKPGNKIVQFSASDMDSGEGEDVYYFLASAEEDIFHLELYSGYLYLLRSLDSERRSLYSLQVTASNSPAQGTPGDLNSSVLFQLTVLDIPDDLHFQKHVYFSTVPENINSSDEVSVVSCDTSTNPNPALTYFISSSPFQIDQNFGSITASSTLDYETSSRYELIISCSCCSSPSLTAHTTLFVSVSDINEFPPLFSARAYAVSVGEETELGTELLQLSSVDQDSGHYGDNILYSLLDHTQLFYLQPNTGILYLRGSLDYRTESSYNLTLLSANSYAASPSDPFTDTATVRVDVTEFVASRPPDCPQELVVVALEETTPTQQPLAQFSCEGSNSSLNFSLHNYNSLLPFSLSQNGTLSLHSPLDYESGITQYFLEIRVTHPHATLFTPIFSQVVVTPVNEHTPSFALPLYSLTLSELTLVGTNLINVSASDADATPDGGVVYEISADYNTFSVDPLSGSIFLISSLDYDSISLYNVTITASDLSTQPLTGSAVLQIQVLNENTLPPICSPHYLSIFINESAPIHSIVATYDCHDPDAILSSGQLTLSVTSPLRRFLTPINGSLVLTTELDYEAATEYAGTLVVSEPNSTFSTQIRLSVFVNPSNEFSPHFTNLPSTLSIDSQTLLSSLLYSVSAVDGDSGRDGEIAYFLNMTEDASIFYIESHTGNIWLRYPLYRIPYTTVEVCIGVEDLSQTRQLANYSTLSVSILHEKSYRCEQYFYPSSIPENTSVNYTLFNISCGSAVEYMLEVTDLFSRTFSVTSQGQLILSAPLDAETADLYESAVTVVFPNNATATVGFSVSIQDINEFSPSFTMSPSHYQLHSDTEVGALLLTFLAVDLDNIYNRVSYSLVNTFPGLYLSTDTGMLFLSSKLIFSQQSPLNLFIMAQDNDPVHSFSTTTQVSIELINANSSDPETLQIYPLKLVFIVSVRENQVTGASIGNVSCYGRSLVLQYRILEGNYGQTFSIDVQSGELFLEKSLDFEEMASFTLSQSCSSSVNANMSSEFLTIVKVVDVNEFAPVVESPNHTLYLKENHTVGEKVHRLVGVDPDDPSVPIIYRITRIEPNTTRFAISERSGEIFLLDKLDYEQQSHYSLCISAYDGEPSELSTRNSQIILTVRVLDINDNSPLCQPVLTLHTNSTSNLTRELVGTLNCSDLDSQQITHLKYFEENTISRDYFDLTQEGNPITWHLYFLTERARASHNGSLFNAYFHNIVCCDGSVPELCTDFLVLVTTVDKPQPPSGLNATQLARAIKSEGLLNLITLLFNISRHYWDEVVDHFKLITANIITTYCISNPFECSLAECSSDSQSEWFSTDNVVIEDVYSVNTDDGTQLEVQFYVSLPNIPTNSNATTNYVVPGGVLLELLSDRRDLLNSILIAPVIPSSSPLQCTQPISQLLPYLLATFALGILFTLALSILAFLIYKLCKCWKEKAHIVISKRRIYPDETERIIISSNEDEMELRETEGEVARRNEEDNLYSNSTITPLSSMSRDIDPRLSEGNISNGGELDKSDWKKAQTLLFKETTKKDSSTPLEESNIMNPFWKTNPRFWRIQDKEIETEYCISPHLSVPEANTSTKDTDSHITEYYSSSDLSVFTSQTGLSQASMKALGKARGRYDLMELTSMESVASPINNTDKKNSKSRPESTNLRSQTTSRSTTLYLPSSSSAASNTSLQELPKSSTAVNIATQNQNQEESNFVPKNAWLQD